MSATAGIRVVDLSPSALCRRPIPVPAVVAVVAGELSLVPTLLPRRPWVQGIFTGVLMANTYAAVLLLLWIVGRVHRGWRVRQAPAGRAPAVGRPGSRSVPSWLGRLGMFLLASGFGAALVAGRGTAVILAERSDGPPPAVLGQLVAALIGIVVAAGIILLGRSVRAAIRHSIRYSAHSRAMARALPAVALALVMGTVGSGALSVPSPGAHPTADWAASVQGRPQVRSGGAGSLVPWASLGVKGQEFVAGGPSAAAIEAVTGRPAIEPIRVYVGNAAAPDPQARSQLALRELRRTGGFGRSVIVLVVPTGSGWVNPAAPSALEYLYGGDVATVAVQYAAVPSWLEYLQGLGPARETSRSLLDTVAAAADQLPSPVRPRLVLYGESLGALSALSALSPGDAHSDAALWVGVPADAPASDLPDQTRIVHADDPVAVWSPRLLLGPTPQWHGPWLPLVSFWQATADLTGAYDIPDGHGHRYAGEFVDAWNAIVPANGRPGSAPAGSYAAIRAAVIRGDLPASSVSNGRT